MQKMELRTFVSDLCVEANEENELKIEGLVNGTETWSHVLGNKKKFIEKINKGVFFRALSKGGRFDFLAEHDRNLLLATTENGSLELWEDEEGLKMRANIVPTSYGKDIYTLIRSRVINNMSFGFKVVKDNWKKGIDGIYERTIEELELFEVSAVRNPAYPCSGIFARNIEVIEDVDIPEIEEAEEERMNPKDLEAIADMVVAKLSQQAQEPQQEEQSEVIEEKVEEVEEAATEPAKEVEEVVEPTIEEPAKEEVVENPVEEVVEVQQEPTLENEEVEAVEPENDLDEFDGKGALIELLKYQSEVEQINE